MKKETLVLFILLAIFTFNISLFPSIIVAASNVDDEMLMQSYVDCINQNNYKAYCDLFVSSESEEMSSFIDEYGDNDFFKERKVVINATRKVSNEYVTDICEISEDEIEYYDDFSCYYVSFSIDWKNGTSEEVYNLFITAKENNNWRILRISEADIAKMVSIKENLGTSGEEKALVVQNNNSIVRSKDLKTASIASLSQPTYITVYFTNTANRKHFESYKATISFESYVKNVIPNEFISSYYSSYPEYKKATSLVVKMYGWYHKTYPKWNFSPYYADVKDSTVDQVYVVGSSNSYSESGWTSIKSKALVTNSGKIFETQYLANSGDTKTGILNATEALTKAKNGDSYGTILKYYYNKSTNAKGETVKVVSH